MKDNKIQQFETVLQYGESSNSNKQINNAYRQQRVRNCNGKNEFNIPTSLVSFSVSQSNSWICLNLEFVIIKNTTARNKSKFGLHGLNSCIYSEHKTIAICRKIARSFMILHRRAKRVRCYRMCDMQSSTSKNLFSICA